MLTNLLFGLFSSSAASQFQLWLFLNIATVTNLNNHEFLMTWETAVDSASRSSLHPCFIRTAMVNFEMLCCFTMYCLILAMPTAGAATDAQRTLYADMCVRFAVRSSVVGLPSLLIPFRRSPNLPRRSLVVPSLPVVASCALIANETPASSVLRSNFFRTSGRPFRFPQLVVANVAR